MTREQLEALLLSMILNRKMYSNPLEQAVSDVALVKAAVAEIERVSRENMSKVLDAMEREMVIEQVARHAPKHGPKN